MALTKYDADGLHYWSPQRKLGGGWLCFKSSPKAPQAPDPVATANAQTQSNINTANANAALNRNNQYTPWGSQTWQEGPKNADGTSQWSSTIKLDPAQQGLLDSNNQISQLLANLGIKQAGNVGSALDKPINYDALPWIRDKAAQGVGPLQNNVSGGGIQRQVDMSGVPTLVGGDALAGVMKDNQGAAYKQQAAYLDSSYGQRQRDLENQLVQQGVTQNSDAWNRAVNNLGQQRTFDYNNAFNNSFQTGLAANNQLFNQGLSANQNAYGQALGNANFANSAQAQDFGQGLANANLFNSSALAGQQANNQASSQNFSQSSSARAQQLQELLQQQQNPINVLNALRSGSQVSAPQFGNTPQGNIANTDIAGLYNNQYQGQLANYNAKVGQQNSLLNAGTQLAAMYFMSDRRLKCDVERIGTHPLGIGLYKFKYIWGESGEGVMADEVERVMPEAVKTHASGYKMVNYGAL